jgi:hypothetical protein
VHGSLNYLLDLQSKQSRPGTVRKTNQPMHLITCVQCIQHMSFVKIARFFALSSRLVEWLLILIADIGVPLKSCLKFKRAENECFIKYSIRLGRNFLYINISSSNSILFLIPNSYPNYSYWIFIIYKIYIKLNLKYLKIMNA